jgi:hypothetical protein
MRRLQKFLAYSFATALLALPASATWSIIVVNTKTGEVAIGSATCLDWFDLQPFLPVVVPGVGAAAAQSSIDQTGANRMQIWNYLHLGISPQDMLVRLQANDGAHSFRQYGIVDMTHFPASFTGINCGQACWSIAGEVDDLRYAIQGNVLAGVLPLYDAEEALLTTPGDLSQKLVAAMEAARADGGDGRCSCSYANPTGCGSPPPSFTYSAYTAFVIVARMGDLEGTCDGVAGCVTGGYWLNLNVVSGPGAPEPVLLLEANYAQWRVQMQGIVDGVQSLVTPSAQALPADGATRVEVDVELRDLDGNAVANPDWLRAKLDPSSPDVELGPVQDLGNGHFRFSLGAGAQTGTARVRLTAHQQQREILLWPELAIAVEPLADFHCGFLEVSASQGAVVPLVANFGAAQAGSPYLILAGSSGTQPGTVFNGISVPLNEDDLFWASVGGANGPRFVDTLGVLGLTGRAQGTYVAPPLALVLSIGQHFDFATLRLPDASGPGFASIADGFLIVP